MLKVLALHERTTQQIAGNNEELIGLQIASFCFMELVVDIGNVRYVE